MRVLLFFSLLIVMESARAEEPSLSCPTAFAKISSYDLERLARAERSKAIAEFIASKASQIKNKTKEIWVEDYLGAWKQGRNIPESSYLFLKRAVLAPRSREKDLALREAEMKKFQAFVFALDPVVDGSVEVASKAKQLFGFGPIERRLSLPTSLLAGSFAYGAIFHKIRQMKKEAIREGATDGVLGAESLKEWLAVGQIDAEKLIGHANEHARMLIRWLEEVDNKKIDRVMPPRFLQFRAEGLLAGDTETKRFEHILLDILEANQKRRENKELPMGDAFVKAEILKRLAVDPLFSKKTLAERELLTLVFDPPIFLGGKKQTLGWVDELRQGKTASYDKLRAHSDLAALKASIQLRSVTDVFGPEPSAAKALFTYSQGYEENQKIIRAKQEAWAADKNLPAEKSYLAGRTDLIFNVEPKLTWVDLENKQTELSSELEIWKLVASHPGFYEINSGWRTGKLRDQDALRLARERIPELAMIHTWQAAKLAKARERNPERKTPLDPLPQEVCVLKKESPYFSGLITRGASLTCAYYEAVHAWRWLAQSESTPPDGAREKARSTCEAPDAKEKLAKAFRVEVGELEVILKCE